MIKLKGKKRDVIKAAPNLLDKFVEFYNAAYPGWDDPLEVSLLTSLFESGKFGCPCKNVVTDYRYILPTDSFYEAAQLILYIERSVTPQDCLEYTLANGDFGFATHGIQEASVYYYYKDLEELNDNEIVELIAISDNPILYNKKSRPDNLVKYVELLKERVSKNSK